MAVSALPDWRTVRILAFLRSGQATDLDGMAEELDMDVEELVCAIRQHACRMGVSFEVFPWARVLH